jgi:hypothetical protein
MKTEQYSFGKVRRKANNKYQWSAVRWGFIFLSLYISLHCCMAEVNQIVLPGHLTMTGYSTGGYVWEKKLKKVSMYAYLCRIFSSRDILVANWYVN